MTLSEAKGFSSLRGLCVLLCLLLGSGAGVCAQESGALSSRNVSYTIQVRLDAVQKTLDASEIISWRNIQPVPAAELRFHLYWNAWRNTQSTWLREARLRRGGADERPPDAWSYCQVQSILLLGDTNAAGASRGTDLTAQMRFISPDDNNPDDATVLAVPLPRPVAPGETIRVGIIWKSKIPRTFARTGFRGNYFFIAQWFPKLGVFEPGGTWNCHQFHASTEFFSDYGVYDVQMRVPRGWLLGATGVAFGVTDNPDGTSTHRYVQEDVHDFVWTTSPDYREARRRFEFPGLRTVDMRLLYQPEHESQVDRHFRATSAALQYYGSWYGQYPYGHITIVDPAFRSGTGGMEYPTLFTAGSRYWAPFGAGQPEGVTIHEAGHQFWYGIVGNNEFEHAWLDEGFNSFSDARTLDAAYGPMHYQDRFFRIGLPVMLRDVTFKRTGLDSYRDVARNDVQATPSYLYFPNSAGGITYSKTSLWLATLERTLGWDTLKKILSTYFDRWKFKHPKPEDFFAVANEASGKDLTPFFDEVHRKAVLFDYSVESVKSEEVKTEGYVLKNGKYVLSAEQAAGVAAGEKAPPKLYETRVVVRRLQDGILPVDVLLKFENGEEQRDVWDGRDLWKLYTVVKPAKLDYAAVDPDHKLLLDIRYTNNTRRLAPASRLPAVKWASKWMIWLQDFMQTMLFLG